MKNPQMTRAEKFFFITLFSLLFFSLLGMAHFISLSSKQEAQLSILMGASLSMIRMPDYLLRAFPQGFSVAELREKFIKKFLESAEAQNPKSHGANAQSRFHWILDPLAYAGIFMIVLGVLELMPASLIAQ